MGEQCAVTDETRGIFAPNNFTIGAGETKSIRVGRPTLWLVTGGGHYAGCLLYVNHKSAPMSSCRLRTWSTNGQVAVPGAGTWQITNSGSAAVELLQVDDPCGKVAGYLRRKGYAVPVHTSPQIGTASTLVIAANVNRRYLLIQWPKARTENLYLSFGPSAVVNEGIEVPAGAAYEMSGENVWPGVVNGIVATTAADALVTEGE